MGSVRMEGWVVALAVVAFGGCEGCGASEEAGEGAAEAASEGARASGAEAPDPEPGTPPEVTVHAEPPELAEPGQQVPVVRSRGEEPVRLGRKVTVERHADGSWRDAATVALRDDCDDPVPDGCVALVPGAELHPPPWLGLLGEAQCACDGCEPAPEGRYRFVVRSCDGAHEVPGEPFGLTR
ncbi:MAG: hypothetical protein ACODAU_04450 [Myxococcota bacterium]